MKIISFKLLVFFSLFPCFVSGSIHFEHVDYNFKQAKKRIDDIDDKLDSVITTLNKRELRNKRLFGDDIPAFLSELLQQYRVEYDMITGLVNSIRLQLPWPDNGLMFDCEIDHGELTEDYFLDLDLLLKDAESRLGSLSAAVGTVKK